MTPESALVIASVAGAARDLGLAVAEPVVLHEGANLVLHLAPSPVVVRVATLTAEMRGNAVDYLRRERDILQALREREIDTVRLTELADPGPHNVDGHWFLLLEHRRLEPVDLDSPEHARAVGSAFVNLSAVLAELPADVARGDEGHPWAEIDRLREIAELTTEASALGTIDRVLQELRATEPPDPWQVVHGDAHRNNVAFAVGPDGRSTHPIWFDFEDANLRPPAWDLATLLRSWPAAGETACAELGVDPQSLTMRWHHELREIYALLWSRLYANRFSIHEKPASKRLKEWQTAHQK